MSCCGYSPSRRKTGRAFTLIEVLVVVAIIALLVAILLPSLAKVRAQTRRRVCLSNISQIGKGLALYQADYKGSLPLYPLLPGEAFTDGMAIWINNAGPTRLGMLYGKYIGREENIFYCPDAKDNNLINKDGTKYPWSNWGTNKGWAYGSYEYRPRYFVPPGPSSWRWAGVDEDKRPSNTSVTADAFAGAWDQHGPYPSHSPIQDNPTMLYYNVGFVDGHATEVKDRESTGDVAPFAKEFRTRAPGPAQTDMGKYTSLKPFNNPTIDPGRKEITLTQTNHIERGWTFFDQRP